MHCMLHTIACRVPNCVGVLHRVRMVIMVMLSMQDTHWGCWYEAIIAVVTGDKERARIAPVMSVMMVA